MNMTLEHLMEVLGYPNLEMVRLWCKEKNVKIEKVGNFEMVPAETIFLTPKYLD